MSSKILLRRGTAAQWSSANPILGIGELGIETDTLKIKIGNGISTWTQLTSYANVTPSQLTSEINNLINAAPSTLDTLNELAAAINNDASFSTTVNNLLTGKVSKSGGDTITASTASTVGLIIKGAVSQTANLQEWQNSSGTTISWVNSTGGISLPRTALIRFNGGVGVDRAYITSNTNNDLIFATAGGAEGFRLYGGSTPSGALLTNSNANSIGFIIKGAASQASNLQEWQNSAGTVIARVQSDGAFVSDYITSGIYLTSLGKLRTGSASNYGAQLEVTPTVNTNIGAVVRGAASQSADLQQWQNSSASVLAKVDSLGNITATDYKLSNSLYNIKKTLKKTIDPAQNAIAGNTYDLFQIAFSSSLQGIFTMQVSIRNGGYGQSMSYTLPATYRMDWLAQYGVTNPFFDGVTSPWVDLTPITFAPRHLMTNDYLKFQARIDNNTIYFRIKLTGQLTSNPLFDVYIQHSEEFANSTVTELSSTGTDFTTSGVLPNFLSSKAGTTAIFNPFTITSSVAANVPLIIKGSASQTGDLQQWQNSGGSAIAFITSAGIGAFTDIRGAGGVLNSLTGFVAKTNLTTRVPMVVQAIASQTANLQEWQNSSGTILANINAFGDVTAAGVFSSGSIRGGTLSSLGGFHSYTSNVPSVPVAINRAAASQTASIEEWQNSAGTVLSKISAGGQIIVTGDSLQNFQSVGASSTLYNGFTVSTNTNAAAYAIGTAGSAETLFGVANSFYIYDGIAGVMRFKIMPTGLVGINSFSPAAQLQINSSSASTAALIVKGAASQTADLQQWQNSAGEIQVSIKPTASLTNVLKFTEQYSFAINWGNNPILSTSTGELVISPYGPERAALIVKGLASQTDNLQEWQQSDGTITTYVGNDGNIFIQNNRALFVNSGYVGSASFVTKAAGPTWRGLVVQGAASQSANLQEWQSSTGTVLANFDASGKLTVSSGAIASTEFYSNGNVAFSGSLTQVNSLSVGAGNSISGRIQIKPYAANNVGIIVQGYASQTANLQEWQNSAGTILGEVVYTGQYINRTQIYADNTQSGSAALVAKTNYGNVTPFVVQGAADAQTADLQKWITHGGTVLAKVDGNGSATFTGSASTNAISAYAGASGTYVFQGFNQSNNLTSIIYQSGEIYSASNIYVRGAANYSAAINVKPGSTSTLGIVIRGLTSQSADLQQWQNSSGAVLAEITASGSLELNGKDIELMNIMGAY